MTNLELSTTLTVLIAALAGYFLVLLAVITMRDKRKDREP